MPAHVPASPLPSTGNRVSVCRVVCSTRVGGRADIIRRRVRAGSAPVPNEEPIMSRTDSQTLLSRLAMALLVAGGLLTVSVLPRPATAQEKKADAKPQEKKPAEKKDEP